MSAPYPTRASSRPAWDTGSTSPRRSPGRPQAGDSPVVDLEAVGLRHLVVENGLLDLFLLGHLPVDFLPPPGPQRDAKPPAFLLECDRRFGCRLERDVPLAHRAAARELDSIEHTSHRRIRAGLHEGPKSFVVPEPALPHRTPPEPPRHVHPQGTKEALEGRRVLRGGPLWMDDRAAAKTFAR